MSGSISAHSWKAFHQQVTSLTELGLPHASRVDLIAELYLAIQQAGEWFNYGSQNLPARFKPICCIFQQTVEFTDIQGQYSELSSAFRTMVQSLLKRMQVRRHFIRGNSVLKRRLNRLNSMKNYGWISANTRLKYWITEQNQIIEHAAEMHLQSPADLL